MWRKKKPRTFGIHNNLIAMAVETMKNMQTNKNHTQQKPRHAHL